VTVNTKISYLTSPKMLGGLTKTIDLCANVILRDAT